MLAGKGEGITVDKEPAEAQNLVFKFIFVAKFPVIKIHQYYFEGNSSAERFICPVVLVVLFSCGTNQVVC